MYSALVPPRRYEEESVPASSQVFCGLLTIVGSPWFVPASPPSLSLSSVASCLCMCVHIPPCFVSTEGPRFMMVQLNIFRLYSGVTVKCIQ